MSKTLFVWFLVLCLTKTTSGWWWWSGPEWDGLQVTWGANPFNSQNFNDLPRTTRDAVREGFTKISDCDWNAQWRGQRYVKGGDYAVILLYDVNGYIAGIQTSIPNNQPDGYPKAVIRPPFVRDGNRYTISAYFVNPAKICGTGRTYAEFLAQGTGTDLYLQLSGVPERSVRLPKVEEYLDTSVWTEGKCFYTMGKHYWHRLSVDMDCDSGIPVFLMYNGGKLNSFGWAFNTDLKSPRYEHPSPDYFKMFMKQPPKCMMETPRVSTMHIFMTKNALLNFC